MSAQQGLNFSGVFSTVSRVLKTQVCTLVRMSRGLPQIRPARFIVQMGGKRTGAKGGAPPMASPKTADGDRYYGGAPPPKGQQRLWKERRAGEDKQPLEVSRKHALQRRWVADEIMTVDHLLSPQEAKELVRPPTTPTAEP